MKKWGLGPPDKPWHFVTMAGPSPRVIDGGRRAALSWPAMTDQEFADLLSLGYERRGLEFKPPGPRSDAYLLAAVARAALGMANLRDGGVIVVGVEEPPGAPISFTGLSSDDLGTWLHDDTISAINAYADPPIAIDTEVRGFHGKAFVVVRVDAFADMPVLCRKDYAKAAQPGRPATLLLRQGACYVRSRRKPETSEIPTQAEMRELLDLATERRLRAFFTQTVAAGLSVERLALTSDRAQFESERIHEDRPERELIRTRGYWRVSIRPESYVPRRVPSVLRAAELVDTLAVRLRGWDFPHRGESSQRSVGSSWVEYAGQPLHYIEWWRIYQSGHFVYEGGFPIDWRDRSRAWPPDAEWKPGQLLGVGDTVYRFTEIFEFAARLAASEAGDEPMRIEIALGGLRDRTLYFDDSRRIPFSVDHTAKIDEYILPVTSTSRSDLAATARDMAVQAARDLFERCGWQTGPELLRAHQEKLGSY